MRADALLYVVEAHRAIFTSAKKEDFEPTFNLFLSTGQAFSGRFLEINPSLGIACVERTERDYGEVYFTIESVVAIRCVSKIPATE